MNVLADQEIDETQRLAELHDRVEWLWSAHLAEAAEVEQSLNNQYEITKKSESEERARAAARLFNFNQRVFSHLNNPSIDQDLYAAVAGLMMAAETARRLLVKEVEA